jgi:SagB-type dehydrogenase family enzyme
MSYAHEYLGAIVRRSRIKMPPDDWEIDWADAPRPWKFYRDAPLFALPTPSAATATANAGTLHDGLFGVTSGDGQPFDLALLSGLLLDSYAQTSRRLGINANDDNPHLPEYKAAKWGRGAASGGGRFPVSMYWVSGASGPLPPGVYYYSVPHHAMQCLLAGDVTGEIRAALGLESAKIGTDQFLVLGIKTWQNSFKYNSFSFHATTMDIGTVIGTWRLWAGARGRKIEPWFWFDESRISRLLGVEDNAEGIFAVVPLHWHGADRSAPPSDSTPRSGTSRVRRQDSERSRRVVVFDAVREMQQVTSGPPAARPAPEALSAAAVKPAAGPRTALPVPCRLDLSPRQALRARRSSFGRFSSASPARGDQLATVLAATAAGGAFSCDVTRPGQELELVKVYAFVNHVDGVEPGAYEFDPVTNELILRKPGTPGPFLQMNYFLTNYNLQQASAVVVPAVRATAVLDALGPPGYRLVNAVIGAASQAAYTACAAIGLGCGAALGFDNVSYIEELGLAETGEVPLLLLMVGGERPGVASYRYELS